MQEDAGTNLGPSVWTCGTPKVTVGAFSPSQFVGKAVSSTPTDRLREDESVVPGQSMCDDHCYEPDRAMLEELDRRRSEWGTEGVIGRA